MNGGPGDDPLSGAPHDPRGGRFDPLARILRWARWIVVVVALGAVGLGVAGLDNPAGVLAIAMVVVLVGVPMMRVGWFARRWTVRGDPRFAMVAGAVLLLPPTGLLISVLTG